MATESYLIRIRQQGAREVRRSLDDVRQGAKGANDALRNLRTGLNLLLGLYGLQALQQYADEYTNLITKLDIATRSSWELVRAEKALFDISNQTRTSFASTADLYGRLERSTRGLAISQDNLLQMTETINKAITLSGASTQAANAAILQLGQGMAAGVLRGDELNSVLEQAPRLAEAIATGMGVAVGDLKTLGEQGAISVTKVVNALASQAATIDEEFKQVSLTIAQSFTVLDNQILRSVGLLDKQFQISETIAKGILFIAYNLDQVAAAAVGAAAGLAVLYSSSVIAGLKTVIALVRGLTLAIATNPLGALAVAAATVIGYLSVMGSEISFFGDEVLKVSDVAKAAFDIVTESIAPIANLLSTEISGALDVVNGYFRQFADWMGVQLPTASEFMYNAVNNVIGAFVLFGNIVEQVFNFMSTGFTQLVSVVTTFGRFVVEGLGNAFQTLGGIFGVVDENVKGSFGTWGEAAKQAINSIVGLLIGLARATGVIFRQIGEIAVAAFDGIGEYAKATWEGVTNVFSGGDFDSAFDDIRSKSTSVFDGMGTEIKDALTSGLDTDYVGELMAKVNDTIASAGLGEGVADDHIANLRSKWDSFYADLTMRAEGHAADRLKVEQITTDEIQKQNKFLEDQAEGLSGKQLEDFTKRLNGMRETLNSMNPTWERSVEVIKAWKEQSLAAVDESWERYDEYATMVEEVTREKVSKAYMDMLENSKEGMDGLVVAAIEMRDQYEDVAAVMKKGVGTVIDQLTNSFMQFAMTGRMSFRELASGLAASIAQMMIRMLMMRAVLAALNVIPGFAAGMAGADVAGQAATASGAATNFAASTGILSQGMGQAQSVPQQAFAKGGAFQKGGTFTNSIVSAPTNFAMAGGLGLMGEAGAEAIMPLTRGKDGKLGVQASGGGGSATQVNVYVVQSEEEAAERMAANPDAVNVLKKAMDREG